MRPSIATCVLALLGLGLTPAAGAGATLARGGGHDAFNFSTDAYSTDAYRAYRAIEGQTPDLVVERGQHGWDTATVDLTAKPGTAGTGDFTPFARTLTFQDPVETRDVPLTTTRDEDVEQLETVNVELSNPTNGAVLGFPRDAVLTIVDDDGPSRFSFEFASYAIFENRGSLLVRVIRSGDATSPASVTVTTVDGTATAGEDYTYTERTVEFPAGGRFGPFGSVTIPLLDDVVVEGNETLSLALSSPVEAELMPPSTATVTLLDDDSASTPDKTPPYTAFHQPLHGRPYAARNLKEFIVFMQDDNGGSGMDRVQLAIRKNLPNGRCRWWTGSAFVRRACDDKRWSKTQATPYSVTTVFDLGTKLDPSTKGSGIKNYTAFSRGWDNVGNVQTIFDKGQNKNTFEIK